MFSLLKGKSEHDDKVQKRGKSLRINKKQEMTTMPPVIDSVAFSCFYLFVKKVLFLIFLFLIHSILLSLTLNPVSGSVHLIFHLLVILNCPICLLIAFLLISGLLTLKNAVTAAAVAVAAAHVFKW